MPFRRRPIRARRPGPLRNPRQPAVPPVVRRALERAQRALATGTPDEAARIYIRLADEAYARGRLRPAVQMDLEATRACLAGQDFAGAQTRALHALERLLVAGRHPHRVKPAVERIAAAMTAQGAEDQARDFRQRVAELLAAHGHSWDDLAAAPDGPAALPATASHGRLAAQCPSCYAPLRPDEVEWVEVDRARCTYCGSIILTS